MAFVIVLSTEANPEDGRNTYGYWTGERFVVQYEEFQRTDPILNENTKRYTSKKRAENAAEKTLERFEYVMSYSIKEVD